MAAAALAAVPEAAVAQPPTNCSSGFGKSFVQATHVGQQGNHIGLRADVWIAAGNNDCARLSTVNVQFGTNGLIEWGWSLGYLWGPADGGSCSSTVYHSSPTRFVIWRPNNGSMHCRPNEGALTSGRQRLFTLQDTNRDTVWTYLMDGVSNGTVDVNFDRGLVTTSSERHRAADSAYAEFYNIDLQVTGSSSWFNYNLTQLSWMDEDPTYNCRQLDPDREEVRQLADTC
jgi:hypothetical protein